MDCLPGLSRLPGLFLELMGTGIRLVCGVVLEPCRKNQRQRGDKEKVSGLFLRPPHCVQRRASETLAPTCRTDPGDTDWVNEKNQTESIAHY